jgi:hypothetical protein
MYVVRVIPQAAKVNPRGLLAFALRTAKRKLDSVGHRCLRRGELFACASCHRTAMLHVNDHGYFVSGNLPEERCN